MPRLSEAQQLQSINRNQIILPDGTITYPKVSTPKRSRKKLYNKDKPYIFRSTGNKLSPQQNVFVAEYLANNCKNASAAAVKAGYSLHSAQKQGSNLLLNPNIQEEIQKQIHAQQKRALLTADKILNDIIKIAEVCSAVITVYDENGVELGKKNVDANAALRAQELLGKSLRMWKEGDEKNSGEVKLNVIIKEDNVGKLEKKL